MLDYFFERGHAVSFPQIEKDLPGHDRSSLFRNLLFFEENGFLHKLTDALGVTKYALCEENCFGHVHNHLEHMHFTCDKCSETFCLDQVKVKRIEMPAGYEAREMVLLAKGVCVNCTTKTQKTSS